MCKRYCKLDADCGGGTAHCSRITCGDARVPYGTCSIECDPRGPKTAGCPAGRDCILYAGDATDCRCYMPKPGGADGDSCLVTLDCLPGNTCVFEGSRHLCRPVCRIDEPSTCPAGRVCSALPDQRTYGACLR
jgi:hypothetical protein